MQLQSEEIKHIADLARLELSESDMEKYGQELSAVLGYIEQLQEIDAKDIEPTAQVTGLTDVWREDIAGEWAAEDNEIALKNAPEYEDGFIKVKRVLA